MLLNILAVPWRALRYVWKAFWADVDRTVYRKNPDCPTCRELDAPCFDCFHDRDLPKL